MRLDTIGIPIGLQGRSSGELDNLWEQIRSEITAAVDGCDAGRSRVSHVDR